MGCSFSSGYWFVFVHTEYCIQKVFTVLNFFPYSVSPCNSLTMLIVSHSKVAQPELWGSLRKPVFWHDRPDMLDTFPREVKKKQLKNGCAKCQTSTILFNKTRCCKRFPVIEKSCNYFLWFVSIIYY